MTARTQKYLSLSRAIRTHLLVEVDTPSKTIRAIHRSSAQQIKGVWYFDILTSIGVLGSNIGSAGGFGRQENVHVTFYGVDLSEAIGQPLRVYLYVPATDDVSLLHAGTVAGIATDRGTSTLQAASTTPETVGNIPTQKITLTEYPNAPLGNIGRIRPVVIGTLDTYPKNIDPESGHLAKAVGLSILSPLKFTATSRAKNPDSVWVLDRQKNIILPMSGNGREFTITPNAQGDIHELGGEGSSHRLVDGGYYGHGSAHAVQTYLRHYLDLLSPKDVEVTWWISLADDDGGNLPDNDRLHVVVRMYPNSGATVNISGGSISFYEKTGWAGYTNGQTITRTLSSAQAASGVRAIAVSLSSLRGNDVIPTELPDFRFSALVTYRNAFSVSGPQLLDACFQGVQGYQDQATNYIDGGVVRQDRLVLTSPIDVLIALLRDKHGGAVAEADIDTANIAAVRTHLGSARLDGQISEPLSFFDIDTLLHTFGIHAKKIGDVYSFFTTSDAPTALLGNEQIIAIQTNTTNTRDIHSEFAVEYRYSHITNRYTRHLLADPYFSLTGQASVSGDTLTFAAGGFDDLDAGMTVHIEAAGLSATKKIKSITSDTILVMDSGGIPATQNVTFWVGVYFSYPCYLAAQKRGHNTTPKRVSLPLVSDDSTAQQVLDHLISQYAVIGHQAKLTLPMNAASISVAEKIAIDHPDLPESLHPTRAGVYTPGLKYSEDTPATGLTWEDTDAQNATKGVLFVATQPKQPASLLYDTDKPENFSQTYRILAFNPVSDPIMGGGKISMGTFANEPNSGSWPNNDTGNGTWFRVRHAGTYRLSVQVDWTGHSNGIFYIDAWHQSTLPDNVEGGTTAITSGWQGGTGNNQLTNKKTIHRDFQLNAGDYIWFRLFTVGKGGFVWKRVKLDRRLSVAEKIAQPEVIRTNNQSGRGLLNSLRQSWPSGSVVYYTPHSWTVTQRIIDTGRDLVTLAARIP